MSCGIELKDGQGCNFCGETNVGQTDPALCENCGGEYKLAEEVACESYTGTFVDKEDITYFPMSVNKTNYIPVFQEDKEKEISFSSFAQEYPVKDAFSDDPEVYNLKQEIKSLKEQNKGFKILLLGILTNYGNLSIPDSILQDINFDLRIEKTYDEMRGSTNIKLVRP